jgi:HAD superfamily hydrolase (TIGR01450 family)
MDGTVNRGRTLIDGADAAYEELSSLGVRWLFLSNNASLMASDLADKLNRLGIPVSNGQVINSASALMRTLRTDFPDARVMVVGGPLLVKGLADQGTMVTDDPLRTDIVVTALDRTITYEKLVWANAAIRGGARFWATNLDATYPAEDGLRPGAGCIAAAVATAAGRPPDRVFGKPSPDMAFLALELLEIPAESCLVVGDRMETDILFARNAGMDSVLVLTGATSRSDLPRYDYRPTYVTESIADLAAMFDARPRTAGDQNER